MLSDNNILELNEEGLLAEVLGFETDEVALSALGSTIQTYRGTSFLDFTGGIAVHACGHNHPEIVAAICEQANRVLHTSDTMRHAPQLELGKWLRNLFEAVAPGERWTFLFKNSGSESIDAAAKLALKATGRNKLVAFEGAFHGRTLFASALSRSKRLHWEAYEPFLAPLRANILHAPAPRCAGCTAHRKAPCCLTGLEAILKEHGREVAALFMEPEQGEGGYVPMPETTAQELRRLADQYGFLLIADEIQSGFGRTGKWFGFQHLGIIPDIVVFGKAVGGGLPLAGITARQSLMDRWEPGEHGTTFGGNPLACAAGLAALKIIARDNLVGQAEKLGERIKARLAPLVGSYGIVDVRGNGLMIGVELRDNAGDPDYKRCDQIKLLVRKAGMMLLTCGAKTGNPATDCAAIRLIPPLNISDETLEQGLSIFVAALKEAQPLAA